MSRQGTLPTLTTVADLVEYLGGIPMDRVRLRPAPGTAQEDDVVAVYVREKRLCELVEGVLVEKAVGYYESVIAGILLQLFNNHLDGDNRGIVAGPDGMLKLGTGLVRIPDVSFVSWSRLPGRKVPRDAIAKVIPDLAIEVLSEGNTPKEMARKLREYFKAGVQAVWLIDPRTRCAEVFSSPTDSIRVDEDGVIQGGAVLPGFEVRLRDLFARASREKPS